ncbi:MAG: putative toxin-antitoxin system toxin component, PIN family [Thiobacillaceae bacterium]|jgi:putative PIN family toxin of toxin-antitoxin system|nr:putative toxin-antitoxin system toxin component, PIN family [Thiobacillaceae bacterium]
MRVVIDTNIWISAALIREGTPARLVGVVLQRHLPVFSAGTFAELETRLWKPKFDRYLSLELRHRILHDLNAVALWVDIPASIAVQTHSCDPDDDKFIHAALAAQAALLVSGDRDLLEAPRLADLTILNPSAALEMLESPQAEPGR